MQVARGRIQGFAIMQARPKRMSTKKEEGNRNELYTLDCIILSVHPSARPFHMYRVTKSDCSCY